MLISLIHPCYYAKLKSFSFKGKQILNDNINFIEMDTYKANLAWAKNTNKAIFNIASMIENNQPFNEIFARILKEVRILNKNDNYGKIRDFETSYPLQKTKRGGEYYEKYEKRLDIKDKSTQDHYYQVKSNEKYAKANTATIRKYSFNPQIIYINYGFNPKNKNSNIDLVKKEYEELKSIKNPTIDDINQSCATIRWLIAQESPFAKGNDSIGNILTRAIYCAYDIHQTPIKAGKSFDFEAFYRNLDEYIKIYPKLFRMKPYKI